MTIIIDGTVGANKAVVLDSAGKLPAIDGSLVTTLNATQVTTGSIATARLDTGTTNGKVLVLDGSGNMPAIAAGAMTGVSSATKSSSDPTISTNPATGLGTKWINTTSGEIFILTDATAGANVWTSTGGTSGNVAPATWYGARGVFGGGYPYNNIMEYITIATTGNVTDFGDLTHSNSNYIGSYSGGGRGCYFGGTHGSAPTDTNIIQYITIASVGDAIDFGDLTTILYGGGGLSDGSRGVKFGGGSPANGSNVIDYVTIATPGNAIDFGDMLTANYRSPCGVSNGTYGLMATGTQSSLSNVIEKITVATTGNSTDWADLVTASKQGSACSSNTRGLWMGGYANNATNTWLNVIQYITIATQGNTIDFGDLTTTVANSASQITDGTKGVTGGGNNPSYRNIIESVVIATTGNATDFGDLSTTRNYVNGVSG
jgi:hypothetical protein